MATTVDDLIGLKDQAVDACHAVVAAWENGDLADAARACQDAVKQAELYDAAEESAAASIADYEENYAEPDHDGPSCERCGMQPAATCECE